MPRYSGGIFFLCRNKRGIVNEKAAFIDLEERAEMQWERGSLRTVIETF